MRSLVILLSLLVFFAYICSASTAAASRKILQEGKATEWTVISDLSAPHVAKVIEFAVREQSRTHFGLTYTLRMVYQGATRFADGGVDYRFFLGVQPQDDGVHTFLVDVFDSLQGYYLLKDFKLIQ